MSNDSSPPCHPHSLTPLLVEPLTLTPALSLMRLSFFRSFVVSRRRVCRFALCVALLCVDYFVLCVRLCSRVRVCVKVCFRVCAQVRVRLCAWPPRHSPTHHHTHTAHRTLSGCACGQLSHLRLPQEYKLKDKMLDSNRSLEVFTKLVFFMCSIEWTQEYHQSNEECTTRWYTACLGVS